MPVGPPCIHLAMLVSGIVVFDILLWVKKNYLIVYTLHLKFFQMELVNPVAFIFGMFSSNLFYVL